MSKRAEDAALKAYPILFSERNLYDDGFKDRRESYIKGYELAEKDTIERAIEWLFSNVRDYLYCCTELGTSGIDPQFFQDFKKAMEEE